MPKKQQQAPEAVTLSAARAANQQQDALSAAKLVRPSKGQNPQRALVYGYDAGGRVPVGATIHVVDRGGLGTAWPTLAAALELTPAATVADLKAGGVTGRSLRRAYRQGLIRFQQ